MSGIGESERLAEEGVISDATPARVALVPVNLSAQYLPKLPLTRPDPTFITHLIASAEQVPQARKARRATPADAQTAYRARRQYPGIGFRTRQII